jgi:hypothetical protein
MGDALTTLSNISGLSRDEVYKIWKQARENNEKLKTCRRHYFKTEPSRLGAKHVCLNCGGAIDAVNLKFYVEGYEAAGGNADTIMPGYHDR